MQTRFPTLLGQASRGTTKVWEAWVSEEEGGASAVAVVRFGARGGKMQTLERRYVCGKNRGKANETTAYQQAVAETARKWKDKVEKQGYREAGGEESAGPGAASEPHAMPEAHTEAGAALLPMLAKTFDVSKLGSARAKTIAFPCLAQPKLDGLRCLIYESRGELVAQSRVGGRFVTVAHILEALRPVFRAFGDGGDAGRLVLDGELYSTAMPFEVLAGRLKKRGQAAEAVYEAEFHVYDLFVLTPAASALPALQPEPCHARLTRLAALLSPRPPPHVRLVDTCACASLEHMRALFAEFTAAGFEGIMLRNADAPYRLGHRSADLQKYKEFAEEEFAIVGFGEAEGRDAGTVVFFCLANLPDPATGETHTFSVRPRGNLAHRASLLAAAPALAARRALLTVVYQELSSHNVPRFPVGKAVRHGY